MPDENLWFFYELYGWDEDVALAQKTLEGDPLYQILIKPSQT